MDSKPHVENLVEFFKVLGEPNRLRIVGLLAQRAYTVEQLSETLDVGASTVSHHLARLARAGLVVSRSESYYNLYALKTGVLSDLAKKLLAQAEPERPTSERVLPEPAPAVTAIAALLLKTASFCWPRKVRFAGSRTLCWATSVTWLRT